MLFGRSLASLDVRLMRKTQLSSVIRHEQIDGHPEVVEMVEAFFQAKIEARFQQESVIYFDFVWYKKFRNSMVSLQWFLITFKFHFHDLPFLNLQFSNNMASKNLWRLRTCLSSIAAWPSWYTRVEATWRVATKRFCSYGLQSPRHPPSTKGFVII